eukprot:gene25783-3643_t
MGEDAASTAMGEARAVEQRIAQRPVLDLYADVTCGAGAPAVDVKVYVGCDRLPPPLDALCAVLGVRACGVTAMPLSSLIPGAPATWAVTSACTRHCVTVPGS